MRLYTYLILILMGLMQSCAEDTVAPIDSTSTSFYIREIQPVFQASCALSGCHVSSTGASGIKMSNYNDVMASVGTRLGKMVIPGDTLNSPLIKVITGGSASVPRMPMGFPDLKHSEILIIKQWIQNNATFE